MISGRLKVSPVHKKRREECVGGCDSRDMKLKEGKSVVKGGSVWMNDFYYGWSCKRSRLEVSLLYAPCSTNFNFNSYYYLFLDAFTQSNIWTSGKKKDEYWHIYWQPVAAGPSKFSLPSGHIAGLDPHFMQFIVVGHKTENWVLITNYVSEPLNYSWTTFFPYVTGSQRKRDFFIILIPTETIALLN